MQPTIAQQAQNGSVTDGARKLFTHADRDGGGSIDLRELSDTIEETGVLVAKETIAEIYIELVGDEPGAKLTEQVS